MSKINDFYKSNKYVILWTISYIAVVWAILLFMFNFNIFSGTQWHMLAHARIHGFAGFVFGLLMLAALPMYIATTCLIIRTKQPIITINITFITKIFGAIIERMTPIPMTDVTTPQITPQATTDTANTNPATAIVENDNENENKFPPSMPRELQAAFVRARNRINTNIATPIGIAPTAVAPDVTVPESNVPGELPLPPDFDFDDTFDDTTPTISAPTFTDINFDDTEYDDTDEDSNNAQPEYNDKNTTTQSATPTINIPEFDTPQNTSPTMADTVKYLNSHGQTAQHQNNMIMTDKLVISIHDDPDFWIADPENWFAAGKQKPSPIIKLIKTSANMRRRPILYLAQTNIMDIETRTTEWTRMGITVITDLSELPL